MIIFFLETLVNYKYYLKINYFYLSMNKYIEYLEKYKIDKSVSIIKFVESYKKLN